MRVSHARLIQAQSCTGLFLFFVLLNFMKGINHCKWRKALFNRFSGIQDNPIPLPGDNFAERLHELLTAGKTRIQNQQKSGLRERIHGYKSLTCTFNPDYSIVNGC